MLEYRISLKKNLSNSIHNIFLKCTYYFITGYWITIVEIGWGMADLGIYCHMFALEESSNFIFLYSFIKFFPL